MIKKSLIAASFVLVANVSADMGRVSWFDQQNGFGYIADQETNESVFVHFTAVAPMLDGTPRALTGGQVVDYQWQVVDGKKQATWVILVE